jgi:DNA gyrase subunit B
MRSSNFWKKIPIMPRIIEKVVLAATARNAARKAREMVQRKGALTGKWSARQTRRLRQPQAQKKARYSSWRATLQVVRPNRAATAIRRLFLPLRGKILNVEKALEHKIYENEEIKNMFTALGVSMSENDEGHRVLNIEKLRYHKIVIMCDADIDGSHITTLILTFFFRYMRELIEKGHVSSPSRRFTW